ncbi:hypothetical protein V500_00030 [Pseudogymnoascus sp. VKM F-4518 (FW-2643)]|nr:hypothetical protein V500_00030 [Pseudogymnoascus sp. VKM F-4518 (FW-2643)]
MDIPTSPQKEQLHEVANLMLDIYRTLVHIRYLDPSWIIEGPHNIDDLLPMYRSYDLDASVIYLYSILPYIEPARGKRMDFFQGGNHRSVIIYNARNHCIWIYDQESGGSTDHNLLEGCKVFSREEYERSQEESREVSEASGEGEEDEEEGGDDEDGEYDEGGQDDEDEDEDEDEENTDEFYDENDGRPAANVLRDIIKWYHELIELPGDGDESGALWDSEILLPLYPKHGWPSETFDGDAFEVDQVRAAATKVAKESAEQPINEVQKHNAWVSDVGGYRKRERADQLARKAAATTDDELWIARWELWKSEEHDRYMVEGLRRSEAAMYNASPARQFQKPDELPLWEERQLRMDSWGKQRELKKIQQEVERLQQASKLQKSSQVKLRYAAKQVAVYQKAHEAARLDAERLFPGRLFTVGLGVEINGQDYEERMGYFTNSIERVQRELELMREWMVQVPNSAQHARQVVKNELDRKEKHLEFYRFIEREISPLQAQDDNERFFDHRREHSRTDWDNGGLPRPEWEALLNEARRRADKAGFYRLSLPVEYGGQNKGNLWMSVIREHLASKGLGLFNDLQNEHSVVGNFPTIVMLLSFGNEAQRKEFIPGQLAGKVIMTFGLTEPDHGSDATHLETVAKPETRNGVKGFVLNGRKKWQTGMHVATHCILFARTSGRVGSTNGITAFIVPAKTPGIKVESYEWTFNMPTDHATVSLKDVWVPSTAIFGPPTSGLSVAQAFLHDNRIRQAASSLGAATFCIQESIKYAKDRKPFGKALAWNQGIQFPLVELLTQTEMLRLLIRKTANDMDSMPHRDVEKKLTDKVSMCNYWANRLCCESADRAIQVHGGVGYSRHKPFEHIYRHHRRYRITEGSEEVQMRKVAFKVFGLSELAKAQKQAAKL